MIKCLSILFTVRSHFQYNNSVSVRRKQDSPPDPKIQKTNKHKMSLHKDVLLSPVCNFCQKKSVDYLQQSIVCQVDPFR